jgi:hypothetical protein
MGIAESGGGSRDREVVQVDHWIYGVMQGVGYTTKAVSRGLGIGLYESDLRGHYTPIRAATAQSDDAVIDMQMIHPVRSGEEILFSRISRGPPDEVDRPTFTNHTAIVPTAVLRSGRITLEAVGRALAEFEKMASDIEGELDPLRVPTRSEPDPGLSFGSGVHRYLSLPSLETLATRMMEDPRCRTLLLCRDSTPETRNKTLCLIIEVLNWACGLPLFSAISDAPTSSALNFFNLVIASRGVRADSTWALLESAISRAALPRVPGQDQVYEILTAAFRGSKVPLSIR